MLWAEAFHKMVGRAQQQVDRDIGKPQSDRRIRFGVYFYSAQSAKPGAEPAKKKAGKAARPRQP